MIEVIFELVVFGKVQQVAVLNLQQILRLLVLHDGGVSQARLKAQTTLHLPGTLERSWDSRRSKSGAASVDEPGEDYGRKGRQKSAASTFLLHAATQELS